LGVGALSLTHLSAVMGLAILILHLVEQPARRALRRAYAGQLGQKQAPARYR